MAHETIDVLRAAALAGQNTPNYQWRPAENALCVKMCTDAVVVVHPAQGRLRVCTMFPNGAVICVPDHSLYYRSDELVDTVQPPH